MLILFDIDGTLLLSQGAGRKAMTEAGRRLIDPEFTLEGVEIAGRLDPVIWNDAAVARGVEDPAARHAEFRRTYRDILAERLAGDGPGASVARLLPGALMLIERLRDLDGVTIGVLTGNYPETGRLKLEAAGLDPGIFPVAAWGSDGATRRDLPAVAIERFREESGQGIEPGRVVIIGDTPHDIDCARANGCLVIGVATGPSHSSDDLARHDPDLMVDDLTDTEAIVGWMMEATGHRSVAS